MNELLGFELAKIQEDVLVFLFFWCSFSPVPTIVSSTYVFLRPLLLEK